MKPVVRIEFNGVDRGDAFLARLVSLSIDDSAGLTADRLEMTFDARAGERIDISAPAVGAELRIFLGYEPTPMYMGSFRVRRWTKSGPVRTLTVEADAAALTTTIRAPKTRSHHAMTVREIVEKIAADHGLTAQVDTEIGAHNVAHIDQQTESDVSFLTRLAKRQGATFKLGDGKIIFAKKGSPTAIDGSAKVMKTILPTQVSSWTATLDGRSDYGSASAEYMDHAKGERLRAHAGTGAPHHRDRRLYGSKEEAEAACKANLGDLNRGKMSVTIDAPGMPEVFAEALVNLKDFDAEADGEYLAKTVRHEFSDRGFTTSVTLEAAE